MNVGIIGCGLIGNKRAAALGDARLFACADIDLERANGMASRFGGYAYRDWQSVINSTDVNIVVVATFNHALAEVCCAAVASGKHVLVEKPAARSVAELDEIRSAAEFSKGLVRVGFNHRYHPAMLKAKAIVDSGELGPLMIVRGRYGHGGRVGYDREWRADPKLAGGGELIDQGVHLIDLSRWYLDEKFDRVSGHACTLYWDMAVDDNAFLTLRTSKGATAFLHVSCSEWKNLFSLEIYGRRGKLHIEGLGGSYGVERLTWYRMLPEMGPPETEAWEYPQGDRSWELEFREFLEDISLDREPAAGLDSARAALDIVERIYDLSR